jgi:hypothetical protein
MSGSDVHFIGGCLCGALRYEAKGASLYAGLCYCTDCRKVSGSGFVPFMGIARSAVQMRGQTVQYRSKAASGTEAVRNFCALCKSLVFGGDVTDDTWNIYAGSLDDAAQFTPRIAIFTKDVPAWLTIPAGLKTFAGLPP